MKATNTPGRGTDTATVSVTISPGRTEHFPLEAIYQHGWLLSTLLVCFFTVGFIGHVLAVSRPLMIAITPEFLLIFGIFSLWPSLAQRGPCFWIWLAGAWCVTFLLEVIGVASGLVFGAYSYGPTLGFPILGVPPVIGFNWIIVVLGAVRLIRRFSSHGILSALLVGLFCIGFDFIMEPVAIHNSYWFWSGGSIPLQNYVAWFFIAAISALSWQLLFKVDFAKGDQFRWEPEDIVAVYIVIQALFFLGQRLIH